MRKSIACALVGLTLLGTGAVTSNSALAYQKRNRGSYNTTVGRFNGSGYSGRLKKITTEQDGMCYSRYVGGDYKVDVRIQRYDGTNSGIWRRIGDSVNTNLPNSLDAGASTRLHFSNDLVTSTNVQVEGNWSPDINDKK